MVCLVLERVWTKFEPNLNLDQICVIWLSPSASPSWNPGAGCCTSLWQCIDGGDGGDGGGGGSGCATGGGSGTGGTGGGGCSGSGRGLVVDHVWTKFEPNHFLSSTASGLNLNLCRTRLDQI